mgnify:CR=1 FL=1
MDKNFLDLNNVRIEISFKSFHELRLKLSFCQENNLYKVNIPCKNILKKDFLLSSIKISRSEFPSIDIIPHFSILHEFRKNKINTQRAFIEYIHVVKNLGCNEVLLVSGSQKRSSLDSVSALSLLKYDSFFKDHDFSIGVAFNPYLPNHLFEDEIIRLENKLLSGLVKSIWIQFGTDYFLLERRIKILKDIIYSALDNRSNRSNISNISNISLFGSILIPSKQFLNRFKFRPWKGVYCSNEFLDSIDFANDTIAKLLNIYNLYKICPIIETEISNDKQLNSLKGIIKA